MTLKERELILNDLKILIVRDVKTLIEEVYPEGFVYEFRYKTNNATHSVEFENEFFNYLNP
jgi:hypothetical protein